MSFNRISERNMSPLAFSILGGMVYFASYICRVNYAAVLAEIIQALSVSKSAASIAITGAFITYGVGQISSGFLGDKIPARWVIFTGLSGSALCNVLTGLSGNISVMTVIWCVNGFFQSMIWPPLIMLLARNLKGEDYKRGSVIVIGGSSLATIMIYLVAPLLIRLGGYTTVFYASALITFVIAVIWIVLSRNIEISGETAAQTAELKTGNLFGLMARSGLIPIFVVIVSMGTLRDGITTWLPVYINQVYHLDTSTSILSSVILPIFTVVCLLIASRLHRRVPNELSASVIIWAAALAASAVLLLTKDSVRLAAVMMTAFMVGCMHGINFMLISHMPDRFVKYRWLSTISGIVNSFTYVGSALSAYGFAYLTEKSGWTATLISWCVICVIGLAISALSRPRYSRFLKSEGWEE